LPDLTLLFLVPVMVHAAALAWGNTHAPVKPFVGWITHGAILYTCTDAWVKLAVLLMSHVVADVVTRVRTVDPLKARGTWACGSLW